MPLSLTATSYCVNLWELLSVLSLEVGRKLLIGLDVLECMIMGSSNMAATLHHTSTGLRTEHCMKRLF